MDQLSNPYSPAYWVEMLWLVKMRFAYYLPLSVAALLLVYDLVRRRQTPLLELGSLAIAGIWVIPQLTLLIPAWVEARYMYPAVVGIAGINALALVWIGQRSRGLMLVCATACAVVGLLMGMRTNVNAANFTSKTAAFNQMMQHVANFVPPEKATVIYAHPGNHYEASISIVHHLGARRVKSPIYLFPAGDFDITNSLALANMTSRFPGRVDTTALGDDLRQAIEPRLRMSLGKDLTAEEVAVVIVLTSMDQFDKAPPAWFVADGFERRTFQTQAYQVTNFRVR
ncbi:MAG: hypothetical protein GY953_48830 [bacterium]|nr:hypothetical protein [bacterium]